MASLPSDSPESMAAPWVRWAILAVVTLAVVIVAVVWGGMSGALLVGWAVGMALAATLILFRRRG
ncbi:MAG: hypothetical protein AB7F35_31150 [Acetobacteraceae bacterium]